VGKVTYQLGKMPVIVDDMLRQLSVMAMLQMYLSKVLLKQRDLPGKKNQRRYSRLEQVPELSF